MNSILERTLTTSLGPTTCAMPPARVMTAIGTTTEWRSELVPRYQRRSEKVLGLREPTRPDME
jgi:hypothetical protein